MGQAADMAAGMRQMQAKMRAVDYGLQLAPIKKRILEKDFTVILEHQPADFMSALISIICDQQTEIAKLKAGGG